MGKKYQLFLAACSFSTLVAAQSDNKGDRIRFGVKGGVHISNMHYSNLDQYDTGGKTGGIGGIFAEFDLGEKRHFSIRPEVVFLSRGSEVNGIYKTDDEIFNYQLKAKYTDIRLPIIYNFNNPDKISPYIYVAPILGITRGGSIDYTTFEYDEPISWPSVDVSSANFSKLNFSAAAGIGVRFPIRLSETKRLHLGLEANYQYGFTDTYGSKEKDGEAIALNRYVYDISGSRKNRGFEIAASISVPMSIFKKSPKKKVEPVYVPAPVVVEEKPAPVIVEEKPCYTLDEIIQLISENKPISGKTICAIDQINFEFGKSSISPDSYDYLNKVAELMKQSDIEVEIKGHTDNVGAEAFNMNLSKQRAKAVYDYLVGKGVDASKLSYSYYGMSRPITTNDTEEGRRINRRVEFEILN